MSGVSAARATGRSRVLARFVAHRGAVGGLALIGCVTVIALIGPAIAPHDPIAQDLAARLNAPSAGHILGQDSLGRDVLSRILVGARVSLAVGLIVVLVSSTVGSAVGAAVGLAGGWVDEVAMRVVDVLLAFPGILLAIALSAVLGPGLDHTVLALCVLGWVGYARLVRGQVLALREREFVQAAVALGASRTRIVMHHLLPNVLAPVLVQATFGMASAIVAEASLSFLGLGVVPPTPSWGSMIDDGRLYLEQAPHVAAFPGLAILITVLGLNFLGDGLRDAFDVKGT